MLRPLLRLCLPAVLLLASSSALAAPPRATGRAAAVPRSTARPAALHSELATFAGGCFWCMETQFEGLPGVRRVTSGYTGGHQDHPTYEEVCSHTTGHLESVEIEFDPAVVSYARLLDRFWHGIDPTQADGQFCDIGDSYRSAIFTHDARQQQLALASRQALEASHVLKSPIVTTIQGAAAFWPAEAYHQDFWKKNPARYHEYREGCGRDRRLAQLWGAAAVKPLVH